MDGVWFYQVYKRESNKCKNPQSIIKAVHEAWCMNVGYLTVGFWVDNGGEFRNMKMEEFVNKFGFKIGLHQLFPLGLTK